MKLAVRRKGALDENFEVFVAAIILDRNSQVCFHKDMVAAEVMKINRARCCARLAA